MTPTTQRWLRGLLAAGYLGLIALGLLSPAQPRIFWTMLLPLLPFAIVLMGFPVWRRLCPLAFFGEGGRRLDRKSQRRVPPWLERWFLPVTFGILLACLVLRLVATNGDGRWLAGLLAVLAVAAFATNRLFTGKTWCNFFCPVGLIERIYTEPNSLHTAGNSQCAQCTACKRHCPDIDQENGYWKELTAPGRQLAFFAFPGLVLAFYVYYWLRYGDWEAYFDGRWTAIPASSDLAFGPGFFFAPQVPAWVAALATLLAFSAVSYLLFRGVEALLARWVAEPERRRHLTLTLAAFAAFNLFYLFAGAPTLRRLPGGTRSVAFAAPLVASLFLVKRWRRTQAHFIGDRGAARLLRAWPFDEPPPSDPREVYGWIQASRHAREKDLDAYSNVVRGMIQDGLVRPGELKLLAGVRERLGISDSEHDAVLERLSEEERHLFEEGAAGGVEERVQLEGYRAAMAEALLRGAGEEELVELQERFGIDAEAQGKALEEVRGASGELFSRAARQLDRARALHADAGALGAGEPSAARLFLCHLLGQLRDRALERALDHFEAAGDTLLIQPLRRRLRDPDAGRRERALELVAMACPGSEELIAEIGPLLARRHEPPTGPVDELEILRRLLGDPSPFLRAAAAWLTVEAGSPHAAALGDELAAARHDSHELVRETVRKDLGPIETLSFLRTSPFFSRLEPAEIYDLSFLAVEQTVEPGELVCTEGDLEPDALFVIVSGEAVLAREHGVDGEQGPREEPVRRRGEMIGELSVLDGRPREATVRAGDGPLHLLRIQGESLRAALSRRPHVTTALLSTLAGRIRRLLH